MFILALTGGVGFLATALIASVHSSWTLAASSVALSATSALWHSTHHPMFWLPDQAAMFAFVGIAGYESISRGGITTGMFAATCGYCTVVYCLGKRWSMWAWHPTEELYYHATLHALPILNLLAIFTFFPNNNEGVPDLLLLPEGNRSAPIGPCLPEG